MLSGPYQSQEYQHRAEAISELRAHEAQRMQAAHGSAAEQVKKHQEKVEETVVEPDHLELGADGQRKEQQARKGKKKGDPSTTEEDQQDIPGPRRSLDGGLHIDVRI